MTGQQFTAWLGLGASVGFCIGVMIGHIPIGLAVGLGLALVSANRDNNRSTMH